MTAGAKGSGVELRWARPADRAVLRAFLERVGFVTRPPATWAALGMSAATAWQGERLLGAIPLEPRRLKVGAGLHWRCLQQTTVAVDPERRGQGIGSALQDFIAETPPANAEAVTVFREQPESPGYRWYRANGFARVQRLWLWRGDLRAGAAPPLLLAPWDDPAVPLAPIEALRRRVCERGTGLTLPRADRSLADWLPMHPYALARRFEIAWQAEPLAYALLGRRPDGGAELLERGCDGDDQEPLGSLLRGLAAAGLIHFHCMLAETDAPAMATLEALGFARVSSMDLLAKPLGAAPLAEPSPADQAGWRHHALDYV